WPGCCRSRGRWWAVPSSRPASFRGFCPERLRKDEPFVALVGGAIRPDPHGDRRIDRGGAVVEHDRAILLDTSGPQAQLGMHAQIPIRSNREAALTRARRIEDPEEAHAPPGVAPARLAHT